MQSAEAGNICFIYCPSAIHALNSFPCSLILHFKQNLEQISSKQSSGHSISIPPVLQVQIIISFYMCRDTESPEQALEENYEMEYLMKGGSWALREIKSCWSWGFIEGIFINPITLKNCFLYVFFKQHQILIKTDTAVQAPCSLLLTEAMWYLHMI